MAMMMTVYFIQLAKTEYNDDYDVPHHVAVQVPGEQAGGLDEKADNNDDVDDKFDNGNNYDDDNIDDNNDDKDDSLFYPAGKGRVQ